MPIDSGKVYLVGAGPGDPGLLTLRGAECLRNADLILYDYLASPELLLATRPNAERICLGRHGHGRMMSQQEINDRLVAAAQTGKTVVRLKGGDPAIFARVAEEIAALDAAGIGYEIVPGVSAAQAASSYTGIPLTDRDEASCVAFVTGQERAGKQVGETLDYGALARFPGTLVFYMGLTSAPIWSHLLIAGGKSTDTPIAVVRRASCADQQTLFTTLGKLAAQLEEGKLRPPAVVIVGAVAQPRSVENWFTMRPLFGQSILVTRPAHQADSMIAALRAAGADVLYQPAIEIGPPADWSPVDAAIEQLAAFDWLVFSSANGVEFFLNRLRARGLDARALAGCRLAAIGPGTVAALEAYHLRADICPESYRAEALAEVLQSQARGQKFLLARASRGREILAQMLTDAGGDVTQATVYQSRDVDAADPAIVEALTAGRIAWTTVTSSAIARSLVALFGEQLRHTRLVAISPLTADTLAALGHPATLVAETYSGQGILNALIAAGGQ